MKNFKYIKLVFVLALVMLLGLGGFGLWQDKQNENRLNKRYQDLTSLSGWDKEPDFSARMDRLRTYIHDNSQFKMDEEFYAIWRDQGAIADAVLAYARGERPDPAHLECSTRSGLMANTARAHGYRTRTIYVYHPVPTLDSHTFLEIFNPDKNAWEAQDPSYDIYWRHEATGNRASILDVMVSPDDYEPCGRKTCGWKNESPQGLKAAVLRPFLDLVSIIDKKADERRTYYTNDVDPAALYNPSGTQGRFCDLIPKNCRNGFVLVNKGKTEE